MKLDDKLNDMFTKGAFIVVSAVAGVSMATTCTYQDLHKKMDAEYSELKKQAGDCEARATACQSGANNYQNQLSQCLGREKGAAVASTAASLSAPLNSCQAELEQCKGSLSEMKESYATLQRSKYVCGKCPECPTVRGKWKKEDKESKK
ncbi:MAG: hypothetical protein AB1668_01715 [Nanoarchaeota archaeon]